METTDSFQIAVIGAGVIGLAVAEELAALFRNVLIVEKNTGFGQETSSRNSMEVRIRGRNGYKIANLNREELFTNDAWNVRGGFIKN